MTWAIRFHPDAEQELKAAYDWYDEQRRGLGNDLLLCVDEAIQKIQRQPDSYPMVHQHVRQVIVRRFPYMVLYSIDRQEIIIHAVFHASRDPAAWQERI